MSDGMLHLGACLGSETPSHTKWRRLQLSLIRKLIKAMMESLRLMLDNINAQVQQLEAENRKMNKSNLQGAEAADNSPWCNRQSSTRKPSESRMASNRSWRLWVGESLACIANVKRPGNSGPQMLPSWRQLFVGAEDWFIQQKWASGTGQVPSARDTQEVTGWGDNCKFVTITDTCKP